MTGQYFSGEFAKISNLFPLSPYYIDRERPHMGGSTAGGRPVNQRFLDFPPRLRYTVLSKTEKEKNR